MKNMYKHLTIFDRKIIEIQLKRWINKTEIAEILNRNKSCIIAKNYCCYITFESFWKLHLRVEFIIISYFWAN